MDFVKVHKAANLPEAHIIEAILNVDGIEVFFLGEGLSIGVGELPLDVNLIDMYVKLKHKEKANLIIKKYEKKLNVHYLKRWKCKKCESVNPSTFDICWKCNS